MEVISLKMDENMLKNIDAALKENNYSTRTEFIREAVRQRLFDLEMRPRLTAEQKKKALANIAKFKGSWKGKASMSEEKARELAAKEYLAERGIDLE